ncbi:leucine-rich repeat protein [Enterococcus casseliflavus]|nr:leucine-rich repeat protein [Enterococcus casseliflavus]
MEKTNKWLSHLSIFLIFGSYVTFPSPIIAQEFTEQVPISEKITENTQQIENKNYEETDKLNIVTDLDQTDTSDYTNETTGNNDNLLDVQEEVLEAVSESEDEEENSNIVPYISEGYSHFESSPGIVVVSTPSDATLDDLATYLDEYFHSTDIQSLTVYGMIDTGTNDRLAHTSALSKFTNLSYLEMVDLEIARQSSLKFLSNLIELYLPKVNIIEALAFWNNISLLKLNAPLVEEIGVNAFANVLNLEVLHTPNWNNVNRSPGFYQGLGPTDSLREISTGDFHIGTSAMEVPVDIFPNLEKQTINGDNVLRNYIIFENVTELTIAGIPWIYSTNLSGNFQNVESISSSSLTSVDLSGFTSLKSIDFDEQLTWILANSFSGTKLETLRLSSVTNRLAADSFVGADHLVEIYLPNIDSVPDSMSLPINLELIGTTSERLSGFNTIVNNNPRVLFAATESNDLLPFEDREVVIGASEILSGDFGSFILNEDLSQTTFEVNQNWYFEGELIGSTDTYTITNMNQNNVGTYQYTASLKSIGNSTYSTYRESRAAQIDIVNEINISSEFSVDSVVGELYELKVPFTSNVTNTSSSFKIAIPNSLKVDVESLEIYMNNSSSTSPLGVTVSSVDQVITISNFPLISGVDYYIKIAIMPIAISQKTDEILVHFLGKTDPQEVSGKVIISPGEFTVSIPEQIDFEKVSLDFSSINSTIKKESQLDIDITSFTSLGESWEIMVSATPFWNVDNQEIDEDVIRLVYKNEGFLIDLSEEMLLSSGTFSGNLDYDFRTDTWKNNSYRLTQLKDEGFHVLVGNNYHGLESQQYYTTELNFTIQYAP